MEGKNNEKNNVVFCINSSGCYKYCVTVYARHNTYSSYVQASTGGSKSTIDIAKVSCILCGIMFVVLGNFMTKAKKNSVVGVRTVWSMHNDNTWRKSNLIGAICIICAGLLTIITTVFANGIISTILMLVYIILASVIAVIYSKKEFDIERKKEGLS